MIDKRLTVRRWLELDHQVVSLQIQQYELFVNDTRELADRRQRSNHFFLAMVSSLIAAIVLLEGSGQSAQRVLVGLKIPGALISFGWWLNIRSFRELSSARFKILSQMEKYLPFDPFDTEWKTLASHDSRYLKLTFLEQMSPVAFGLMFLFFLLGG